MNDMFFLIKNGLLPFQGEITTILTPRALPRAMSILAFQADLMELGNLNNNYATRL